MKFYIMLFLFGLVILLFSGCASSGFNTANHNGKLYFFPKNCSHFRYSYKNPDELHCVGDNGQLTGRVLYPADKEQVQNYRYQEKKNKEGWDSLNNSIEKMNENMRKNNEDMMKTYEMLTPKRYDVYHHYGY